MSGNFGWLDGATLLLYAAALAAIGIHFSRRQRSLREYFLAGQSMAWLPVGLSLMAALNSGIDYVMQPSATIRYGTVLLTGTASWLLLYPWVARVTAPFYRRLQLFSAYEYLERRFDVRVRALGAAIFILWRVGWMATALYVPCFAVSTASGGRLPLLPLVVGLGIVVTLYTMLGGIQGVIWTDVLQFCVMFGGLAATVAIAIAGVPGGMAEIWHAAGAAGKLSPAVPTVVPEGAGPWASLRAFFTEPVTIPGLLTAALVGRLATYTSDQVMIQRFQTTRSVRDTRQAFAVNAVGDALWMGGLTFIGLALHAYFLHHPMPTGSKPDQVFPHFMAQAFPPGAVGLVMAAIFAASLSSIDSALNSCTSVFVVDVWNRLVLRRTGDLAELSAAEQRAQVRISRIAAVVLGGAGVLLAANVGRFGDLIEICNRVINSFTGPLLAIFLLGMFHRRARSRDVLAGGLVGTGVTLYTAFFSPLSFLWPSACGLVSALAVSALSAALIPGPVPERSRDLLWRTVVKA